MEKKCIQCGKKFPGLLDLVVHVKEKHAAGRPSPQRIRLEGELSSDGRKKR